MISSHPFLIYKASAGTGKTFALVKEFLRLSLQAPEAELDSRFARILAITFTNKAAGEMKERILFYLHALATRSDSKGMEAALVDALGMDADELSRRARRVHSAVLHHYSDLSVLTIDSFLQRVVRTFAHDLKVPLNVQIELDQQVMVDDLGELLMKEAGAEGKEGLTRVMCRFGEAKMSDEKGYKIENEIKKLALLLFEEDAAQQLARLQSLTTTQFLEVSERLRTEKRAIEKRWQQQAQELMTYYTEHCGLSEADFPYRNKGTLYSYVLHASQGDWSSLLSPSARMVSQAESGDLKRKELKPVEERFFAYFFDTQREVCHYNTCVLLMQNVYTMALLNRMNELLTDYMAENETMHISEVGKLIGRVVQDEPIPFVYERLGNRYRNVLIDEFQDTSTLQWHNLMPLVANSVAENQECLVVGDGKQAIYRFRKGDVRQFVRLPQVDDPFHGRAFLGRDEQIALHTNWRTKPVVVQFNNHFFRHLVEQHFADNELLQQIYIGSADERHADGEVALTQRWPDTKQGGYVELQFVGDAPAEQQVYDALCRLCAAGYQLGDICIISNGNRELSKLATFLTSRRIDGRLVKVASADALLLDKSLVVRLLHNAMRFLVSPSDRLAALNVLELLHQLQRIDKRVESLVDLSASRQRGIDLDSVLRNEGYPFDSQRLRSVSLYECCEQLLRLFRLEEVETAFAAALLNTALRFGNTHQQGLSAFVDYLDVQLPKISASSAEADDAVRLMTVHKAKGLEAPAVIYLQMPQRQHEVRRWVEVDEARYGLPVAYVAISSKSAHSDFESIYNTERRDEEMDAVNRWYVALTRPRDALIVVGPSPSNDKKQTKSATKQAESKSLSRLLYDFATGDGRALGLSPLALPCATAGDPTAEPVPSDAADLPETGDSDEHSPRAVEAFACGQLQAPQAGPSDDASTEMVLRHLTFPDWEARIAIAAQPDTSSSAKAERIRHGQLIHDVLATVVDASQADEALARYARLHGIAPEATRELEAQLRRLVTDPRCSPFFATGNEVRTECALLFDGKELRPDRVVFAPDATWVVDYKTGSRQQEHVQQVDRYCRALQAMGHAPVRGVLLYLSPTGIERVDVATPTPPVA
ncbi:MAG: UvrD-helicase domain-containing protein [Bacteroidales bacterium]|nr:UvrD-helicase domain-containing protein [Bacteroidales bacterium]